MRVLVIEDSDIDFRFIERALGEDFTLSRASTLAAGLAAGGREEFELVILDLFLGDSAGFETFEKAQAALPRTPILVLTGLEDQELALLAVASGAQDFIPKSRLLDYPLDRAARYAIERKRAEAALAESERFARSVVDALRKHIAILDESGEIIATNASWREFGRANGSVKGRCGDGVNYLAICDASAAGGDVTAEAAARGIRAVLHREQDSFDLEYPCHSPTTERWFTMRATRFSGDGPVRVVVAHDEVTARRVAEHDLRFQKVLLEAQIESSIDGILFTSPGPAIMRCNSRFREMWRLPQEVIDRGDDAALEHVRNSLVKPDAFVARVRHLNRHPYETGNDEIQLIDGRTFDRYSAPIILDGQFVGRVWYFRDVTESKRSAQLEMERAGLKEAVRGMEQVLGVVGHELRTPLAGLRAISEFLLTDAARGTAEFDVFLKGINDEVVRMSETVHNLLEAARLNSGKAKWNFCDFELSHVCDDALESVRPLVDESKLAVTFDVSPPDLRMHGDPDAVRRLIVNLATNSRKHTESGHVHVGIAARSDEGGDWIDLCISDTGTGIPPEILKRLGEAFALNSGSVGANHVSGTGLGIAICKAIVAAHGGHLRVRSAVNQGTAVTASLRADLTGAVALESGPTSNVMIFQESAAEVTR